MQVLAPYRLVQPHLGADLRDGFRRGQVAQHDLHRVPGHDVQDKKRDQGNRQDHAQRLQHASDQIIDHEIPRSNKERRQAQ